MTRGYETRSSTILMSTANAESDGVITRVEIRSRRS
jgi:hypothetical protein